MMKSKNIYWSFLLLLAICSCKKQLDVLPSNAEVDGSMITDAKSATTVLNGVYYRFANAGFDNNSAPAVNWQEANEWTFSTLAGTVALGQYGDNKLVDHSYNATSYGLTVFWDYGYGVVNAANGFLKNITPVNNMPAAQKKQMIAEAKFLRAYANAYLLFTFGEYTDVNSAYGILLRTEFVVPGGINMPRSTVKETYDFILKDLDDVIVDLPNRNTQTYYANKWVAELLKARVLINRAASGDYATVISLTQDIIAHSAFNLEASLKDIFWTKGPASSEVMLSVAPYPAQNAKYRTYIYYLTTPASNLLISMLQNDPRNTWVYQTINNPYYGPTPGITKYYPGSLDDPASVPVMENGYAFRLTEAYLLQAEAIAASGGNLDDAKALLKTVQGHAGITDFSAVNNANTAAAVKELVIKEEMINFICEDGQDWLAVRRLPFERLKTYVPTITSPLQLVLPIPISEMKANDKMTQNKGYQ